MKIKIFFKYIFISIFSLIITFGITSCLDGDEEYPNGGGIPTLSLFIPEKITLDDEGFISTYTITYDDERRITGIDNKYGKDTYTYKMEYDSVGNLSKVNYKWDANIETYTYTYSDNRVTVFIKKNENESSRVYVIDSAGIVINSIYYDSYGTQKNISYLYDRQDRLIQRITDDINLSPYYIRYNEELESIGTNINVSRLMALSLSFEECDDSVFSLILLNQKAIAATEYTHYSEKETDTYSYTLNSKGYPETCRVVNINNEGESLEYVARITYKEIKQ